MQKKTTYNGDFAPEQDTQAWPSLSSPISFYLPSPSFLPILEKQIWPLN